MSDLVLLRLHEKKLSSSDVLLNTSINNLPDADHYEGKTCHGQWGCVPLFLLIVYDILNYEFVI